MTRGASAEFHSLSDQNFYGQFFAKIHITAYAYIPTFSTQYAPLWENVDISWILYSRDVGGIFNDFAICILGQSDLTSHWANFW